MLYGTPEVTEGEGEVTPEKDEDEKETGNKEKGQRDAMKVDGEEEETPDVAAIDKEEAKNSKKEQQNDTKTYGEEETPHEVKERTAARLAVLGCSRLTYIVCNAVNRHGQTLEEALALCKKLNM